MERPQTDCLVIGGGAAGATLALLLARRGVSVSLVDDGYVAFAPAEGGEYIFYTDADVAMALQDSAGAAIAWEEECTSGCSDACGAIVGRRVVDLDQVGTYYLQFAPASVMTVNIVHVLAGDHAHEE